MLRVSYFDYIHKEYDALLSPLLDAMPIAIGTSFQFLCPRMANQNSRTWSRRRQTLFILPWILFNKFKSLLQDLRSRASPQMFDFEQLLMIIVIHH